MWNSPDRCPRLLGHRGMQRKPHPELLPALLESASLKRGGRQPWPNNPAIGATHPAAAQPRLHSARRHPLVAHPPARPWCLCAPNCSLRGCCSRFGTPSVRVQPACCRDCSVRQGLWPPAAAGWPSAAAARQCGSSGSGISLLGRMRRRSRGSRPSMSSSWLRRSSRHAH